MPQTNPACPPMAQVSIGDRHRTLPGPLPSNSNHSHSRTVHQPPRAYIQPQPHCHSRNSSNEPHQLIRSQGSVSSEGTGSSSPSIHKPYPSRTSTYRYQLSPHAETGSMGDSTEGRHTYVGSYAGSRQETSIRQHGVGEDAVVTHRYIQARNHEDVNDHAIWILVRLGGCCRLE
jgi:hypothetical protein